MFLNKKRRESDCQGSERERKKKEREVKLTSFPVEHSEVVERGRHRGVVLPEGLLPDRERVVQEVRSLLILVLVPKLKLNIRYTHNKKL